jgi:hypothetical protein
MASVTPVSSKSSGCLSFNPNPPTPKDMAEFTVWYTDDPNHAKYLTSNTVLKDYKPNIKSISSATSKDFSRNPDKIQQILYLDQPDLIVTHGPLDEPVLGLEISAQKPVGFNVFQRFARAIACAEKGVPFVSIFPERSWTIREDSERWDYADTRIYQAMLRAMKFHQTPVMWFPWETGEKANKQRGKLLFDDEYVTMPNSDTSEMKALFEFVNKVVFYSQTEKQFEGLLREPIVMSREEMMWKKFSERKPESPPGSTLTKKTRELTKYIKDNTGLEIELESLPDYVRNREECFIYRADVANFRADPYTGVIMALDYTYTRTGPTRRHRSMTFVTHFPKVPVKEVQAKYENYYEKRCAFNPNYNPSETGDQFLTLHLQEGCRYTKPKEMRIYFYFSDITILKDFVLF